MKRLSWDEYFSKIVKVTSERSPCERLKVGCILVKDNRIISQGYNGFLPKCPHVSIVRDNHEQATLHAEQNAIIDGATHVLSWSFNRFNVLEVHFFQAKEYLKKKQTYSWSIFALPMDKNELKTILLPSALAIDKSGNLIVASSSTHNLYRISLDQKVEKLTSGKIYNADLIHPSGIDVGTDGKLYISDRDNNRVFNMLNGKYNMLADRTSSTKNELPTSIRVLDNGTIIVLCEGDQSIRSISERGRISTILNPGVIEGMKDIAVDNKGEFYAVSQYLGQVFKIVVIYKVELVAGAKKGTGLTGNGIIAKEAELF